MTHDSDEVITSAAWNESEYVGATITNIRRGTGDRSRYVYAELRSAKGELLISATLGYITVAVEKRLP